MCCHQRHAPDDSQKHPVLVDRKATLDAEPPHDRSTQRGRSWCPAPPGERPLGRTTPRGRRHPRKIPGAPRPNSPPSERPSERSLERACHWHRLPVKGTTPGEQTVSTDTNRLLLHALTVTTSFSRSVGLSSNADLRHKVSGAHSTTPPFPRATCDIELGTSVAGAAGNFTRIRLTPPPTTPALVSISSLEAQTRSRQWTSLLPAHRRSHA